MPTESVFSARTEISWDEFPRSVHILWLSPGEITNLRPPRMALNVTNRNILNSVNDLYKWRAKRKGRQISLHPKHPLSCCNNLLSSDHHFQLHQLRISCSRHSCITSIICHLTFTKCISVSTYLYEVFLYKNLMKCFSIRTYLHELFLHTNLPLQSVSL